MVINIITGISAEIPTLAICMHYIFHEASHSSVKVKMMSWYQRTMLLLGMCNVTPASVYIVLVGPTVTV